MHQTYHTVYIYVLLLQHEVAATRNIVANCTKDCELGAPALISCSCTIHTCHNVCIFWLRTVFERTSMSMAPNRQLVWLDPSHLFISPIHTQGKEALIAILVQLSIIHFYSNRIPEDVGPLWISIIKNYLLSNGLFHTQYKVIIQLQLLQRTTTVNLRGVFSCNCYITKNNYGYHFQDVFLQVNVFEIWHQGQVVDKILLVLLVIEPWRPGWQQ